MITTQKANHKPQQQIKTPKIHKNTDKKIVVFIGVNIEF